MTTATTTRHAAGCHRRRQSVRQRGDTAVRALDGDGVGFQPDAHRDHGPLGAPASPP